MINEISRDPLLGAMESSGRGMGVQSTRLRLSSENLSNADTPGYRRKLATFREGENGVEIGRLLLDQKKGKQLFEPSHPLADDKGIVTLSNVNMMIELADAREAGRSYDANIRAFDQARKLYSNLLNILKR